MQLICDVSNAVVDAFRPLQMRCDVSVAEESVDLWLHGIIGDDTTQTDSLSIGRILAANRGKPVTMRVNSPGGLAYDGVAMFNAIKGHDATTTAVIEGLAGSAASLAAIACDHVHCQPGSAFHPHYSLVVAIGHQAEIRDALLGQERLDTDLEQMYAEESGRSVKQVKADLIGPNGDGTRFSAEEAVAAGYADKLIVRPGKNTKEAATTRDSMLAARVSQFDVMRKTFDSPMRKR